MKESGDLFGEIWLPIVDFPDYVVSSYGRVKRVTKGCGTWVGRILKPSKTHGYLHVSLSSRSIVVNKRLHVTVCEAFHGPRPSDDYDAAHGDGDRTNNHASNLSWKTKKANQFDRVLHGTDIRGEQVFGAKLTEDDIRQIRTRAANGESRKYLASEFDTDYSNLCLIATNKTWRHVT